MMEDLASWRWYSSVVSNGWRRRDSGMDEEKDFASYVTGDERSCIPAYVAHISEDGKRYESVEEHLRAVSETAARFAEPFGASSWARAAGLAHDAGKYSNAFQCRILRNGPKVDHSTAGAFELKGVAAGLLSYCVAGHHGGLPNGGSLVDDGGSLLGRLKVADRGGIPDHSAFQNGVALPEVDPPVFKVLPKTNEDGAFSLSMLTRMVFSCLVDADFLCAEAFMAGKPREGMGADSLSALCDRLESHLMGFYPLRGAVNEARCGMLDDCLAASRKRPGVFSLTAPTGSGKTLGLLRFALNHARAQQTAMQRIICAIPYTSIIEQNAAIYREVLGECNVLEHHSSFDYGDSEDPSSSLNRMKLAAENWDVPVVVTTNVQFFESLFASKTSRCRKLHNIANSVIMLDEAQMIPTKFLRPCVKALAELVKNYGCSVVLCTATQPCLEGYFGNEGLIVEEISGNPRDLSKSLERVTYRRDGKLDDEQIANALLEYDQALCIVNSRKQARCLFDRLKGSGCGDGVYHLTTMMHSAHRKRVLASITERLQRGGRCIVVATCLVEAGVDLDFPIVYRAVAGVDSLVQAAGRCNREGKRAAQDSAVHLFVPTDPYSIPADVGQRAQVAQSVLPGLLEASDEPLDVENQVPAYFERLYLAKGESQLDEKKIVQRMSQNSSQNGIAIFPFEDVGRDFKLIEEGSTPLVIPCEENEDALERARDGAFSRGDWRTLSRYSVSLYSSDIRALDDAGAIESLTSDTYVLLDKEFYRDDVGLDIARAGGDALFF